MKPSNPALTLGWWLVLALALLGALPFWLSQLDISAASAFYFPASDNPWPLGKHPASVLLYKLGSGLAWVALAFAGLTLAVRGLRQRPGYQRMALVLIATVAIGPGLLVNAIGKDLTGRPRPRHVEALGGNAEYRPPLLLGTAGTGKSFPCGHCSVGFAVGAAGFAIAHARPWLGTGIVVFSLLLGGGIGVARMSAGGHFLSDIIWSAALTWAAALGVIWWLQVRDGKPQTRPWPAWATRGVPVLLLLGVLGGLMLARPFHSNIDVRPQLAAHDYQLHLPSADLRVLVDANLDAPLHLTGEVRGFGLPNVRTVQQQADAAGHWRYDLQVQGWTKEIEAPLTLRVHPDALAHVQVQMGQADAFSATELVAASARQASAHGAGTH